MKRKGIKDLNSETISSFDDLLPFEKEFSKSWKKKGFRIIAKRRKR